MARIPPVVVESGGSDLDEKLNDLELNEKDTLFVVEDTEEPSKEKAEQTTPTDPSTKELPRALLPDSNSNQATN